jgi:hypothetical protein
MKGTARAFSLLIVHCSFFIVHFFRTPKSGFFRARAAPNSVHWVERPT